MEIATVDRNITRKGRKEKERRKKSNRTEEKSSRERIPAGWKKEMEKGKTLLQIGVSNPAGVF